MDTRTAAGILTLGALLALALLPAGLPTILQRHQPAALRSDAQALEALSLVLTDAYALKEERGSYEAVSLDDFKRRQPGLTFTAGVSRSPQQISMSANSTGNEVVAMVRSASGACLWLSDLGTYGMSSGKRLPPEPCLAEALYAGS